MCVKCFSNVFNDPYYGLSLKMRVLYIPIKFRHKVRKSKQNAIIFISKQVNKIENVLTMLNFLWYQISFVFIVSLQWFVSMVL